MLKKKPRIRIHNKYKRAKTAEEEYRYRELKDCLKNLFKRKEKAPRKANKVKSARPSNAIPEQKPEDKESKVNKQAPWYLNRQAERAARA